jgi:hypothetical protein
VQQSVHSFLCPGRGDYTLVFQTEELEKRFAERGQAFAIWAKQNRSNSILTIGDYWPRASFRAGWGVRAADL